MFDIGGGELLLIIVAVLIFFGPKKIPEVARTIGKGLYHIRKVQSQFTSQMNIMQYEIENQVDKESENTKLKEPVLKEPEPAPEPKIEQNI